MTQSRRNAKAVFLMEGEGGRSSALELNFVNFWINQNGVVILFL